MSSPAPAAPSHLLRTHSADVTALFFSDDNERLYSGDASGRVVVTSTRSLRAIASWAAHTDSILGVQEWAARIITHARDHKLHVWARAAELPRVGGAAVLADGPAPALCYSLDLNALNYCRFSLLPQSADADEPQALLAVPNLVESSEADVWALPSRERVHASVGTQRTAPMFSLEGREGMKTGIIMSMHLFSAQNMEAAASSSKQLADELRVVCAYEDGSVTLRRYPQTGPATSVEGRGWEVLWTSKLHVEAIMAMRVSRDNRIALTVSADHLVGRYDLSSSAPLDTRCAVYRTTHPGNGCVAIRDDGRVCAIGGWDGRVRLYSTKKLKPLGTLRYHKSGCQAVEFARSSDEQTPDDDDDEFSEAERQERSRWFAGGAKDHCVSLWTLISFEKNEKG